MLKALIGQFPMADRDLLREIVESLMGKDVPTLLWKRREALITSMLEAVPGDLPVGKSYTKLRKKLMGAFKAAFKCYAGKLHIVRGGRKGYAPIFEQVTKFPGRTAEISRSSDLLGQSRADKSWLNGLPRLIFVSDMGDVLSNGIDHAYLIKEIIEPASSEAGSRHIWLWLTKRPQRMATFSDWLSKQKIPWPDNLVAMTSVTSNKTLTRIGHLKEVKARYKGISVEPLWESITPDLHGIDWCIVGGESGGSAEAFDLAWARSLRDICEKSGTAFFLKQLGAAPAENQKPLKLADGHGGDWNEWPSDLKMRAMPQGFYELGSAI